MNWVAWRAAIDLSRISCWSSLKPKSVDSNMFISTFRVKMYKGRSLPSAIAMNSSYSYCWRGNLLFDGNSFLNSYSQLPQIVANGSIIFESYSSCSISLTFKPENCLLKIFGIEKACATPSSYASWWNKNVSSNSFSKRIYTFRFCQFFKSLASIDLTADFLSLKMTLDFPIKNIGK